MGTRLNLPDVRMKLRVKNIGEVYCLNLENGVYTFLHRNEDGTIKRYDVGRENITCAESGNYSFEKVERIRSVESRDFAGLDEKLKEVEL